MEENNFIKGIIEKLQMAIELPKCRECGCMEKTLETMKNELLKIKNNNLLELSNEVENSIKRMKPIKYT